jgi:hypothetical protein
METIAFLQHMTGIDPFALIFAVVVSGLIIYASHEIRFKRLRLIIDYEDSFNFQTDEKSTDVPRPSISNNPTFEFVKAKYVADIRDAETGIASSDSVGSITTDLKIKALLANPPGFFSLQTNRRLLIAAICFAAITYFGFTVALTSVRCLASNGACSDPLLNLIFVGGLGANEADTRRFAEQTLTVAALAFLGSYIAAIRELLRRMALFDLSSYAFLKLAAEILASVLGVIFLYRALPDPFGQIATIANSAQWQVPQSIPFVWLGLAPLLGLFPESATKFLLLRFRRWFSWIRSEDTRFEGVTPLTPLDVIDGIDFWTRIRLEQCGIFDVQNLATYNPIMLYIETPYGIYQAFDWIAQAQLCHIVGIEKYLLFREINVRTIFDLERAIMSKTSPRSFDHVYAGILLAPTASLKTTSEIAKTSFVITENGKATAVEYQAYCKWVYDTLNTSPDALSTAIEHMIRWITDDLHVRRLRRMWVEISLSLTSVADRLPDGKDLAAADAETA